MTRNVVAVSGPFTLDAVSVKLMISPAVALAGPVLAIVRLAPLMTVVFLVSTSLPALASMLPAALMLACVVATPATDPWPMNVVVHTACVASVA